MRPILNVFLFLTIVILSGCGQRGALYFPDDVQATQDGGAGSNQQSTVPENTKTQ
ncbi:LPS translocon maturation chaperone LptM [Veronia pacifica]|uniref:LPS translocon maturation chaperone LptM n=1 Tax=Veronia pacifica TaxID=1080227 RepID=UPI0009F73960|nr:lipoprotein [Veronia pacifica]